MNHGFPLAEILQNFRIEGRFLHAQSHGTGHINDSYRVTFLHRDITTPYLLQRLNTHIFQRPGLLMDNIQRVTAHLATKLTSQPDPTRLTLTLIPTQDGPVYYQDPFGNIWRVFRFIENTIAYDSITSPTQAFQVARAFGHFQHLLADLPAPRLHETIPGFHDTPTRLLALEHAIASDPANRAASAAPEIAFARSRRFIATLLLDAKLPERVTHNDTKINNILFDLSTAEALCVVDLDTVMPGLALYDFGDMVRTATSPTAEDEINLSRVALQLPMFEALLRGYLASTATFLTPAEKAHLPIAGKVIAYEQGLRFLTDHLAGDTYYKTTHLNQNLDRCRTQFKLVESIEQQEPQMHQILRTL